MTKRDLISRTVAVLKDNNVRKPISIPKHAFHISDDEGNKTNFTIKKREKNVIYTSGDVEAILNACLYVIMDAIRHGEEVFIHGFGKLFLKYQKEHMVHNVLDNEVVKVEGRYSPKFACGNDLRRCAQIYEQSLKDQEINTPLPLFHDEVEPDAD